MQILDQPLYLTLNLCRVLAACRQGLVLSKCEGVCWAMQEDSLAEFLPMLKQAQLCYQSAEEFIWESEPLKRFAKIALNQIDSALLKTQQDEKRRICQMEQNKAEKWCKIEIYNEYLKKIPSLLVQIHAVEKMYEKAKLAQQLLTTQPENDSRRRGRGAGAGAAGGGRASVRLPFAGDAGGAASGAGTQGTVGGGAG